jgi:hypothetical protein
MLYITLVLSLNISDMKRRILEVVCDSFETRTICIGGNFTHNMSANCTVVCLNLLQFVYLCINNSDQREAPWFLDKVHCY